jgi:dTDP-4-dehydrorhamnose reductase
MDSSILNNGNILVLGGSGFIGRHLHGCLVERLGRARVIATYNETPFAGGVRFDAMSTELWQTIHGLEKFSHAVILLANPRPDDCARNPEASWALNVTAMKAIIDQLSESSVRPVFASTEAVFDGQRGDYVESDPTNPILLYGKQKAEIEEYLRTRVPDALILRIASVYGSDPAGSGVVAGWYRTVAGGADTVKCAGDYIASPVHVDDVAEAILRLIENGRHGTYHIAGPQPLSRQGMFETLLEEMRRSGPVEVDVVSCSIDDFPTEERRPRNISMAADKLIAETGLAPRDLRSACRHLVDAAGQAVA